MRFTSAVLVCCTWMLSCSATANRGDDGLADERARRCVKEHPGSPGDSQALLEASQAIDECLSDDGTCQASIECTGTVEDRECEPEVVLGPRAASCVASAAGLDEGLDGLRASLVYHVGQRRIVWQVQNTLTRGADGGASGGGVTIDAVTGEVLDSFGWSAIP